LKVKQPPQAFISNDDNHTTKTKIIILNF